MTIDEHFAIVVMAAGLSRRLGKPKQLLPYRGTTLLGHTLKCAQQSRCRPLIVVVPPNPEIVEEATLSKWIVAHNEKPESGMGHSIVSAMQVLREIEGYSSLAGVILSVCDQPHIRTEIFDGLIDTYRSGEKPAVACFYRNKPGVPALFAREFFDQLSTLEGDRGARDILRGNRRNIALVPFDGGEIDIDTMDDYQNLHGEK